MMKKMIFISLVLLSSFQLSAQMGWNGVVAHRGGIYNDPAIPENSIAALKKSIELGCYAAEIDVHLTKDLVPVVFHDHEYNGMHVEKVTYNDLKGIRLSNGEPIPTLDQYLKVVMNDPKIRLWIDLKRSQLEPERNVLLAQYVAQVIQQNFAEKRAEIIAPMFDAMIRIKQIAPQVKLYYIGVDKTPGTLRNLGFDGVNLSYKRFDKEYSITETIAAGLYVGAYVIDDPVEMEKQIKNGVHFITTNKPEVLIQVIEKLKKKL
jgi:glycerophosphoryl diester phosphodiesterase